MDVKTDNEDVVAKGVTVSEGPMEAIFAKIGFGEDEAAGKYVCSVCGYIYDPAEFDGAFFEGLPEDWKCPRCKQGKEKFVLAQGF